MPAWHGDLKGRHGHPSIEGHGGRCARDRPNHLSRLRHHRDHMAGSARRLQRFYSRTGRVRRLASLSDRRPKRSKRGIVGATRRSAADTAVRRSKCRYCTSESATPRVAAERCLSIPSSKTAIGQFWRVGKRARHCRGFAPAAPREEIPEGPCIMASRVALLCVVHYLRRPTGAFRGERRSQAHVAPECRFVLSSQTIGHVLESGSEDPRLSDRAGPVRARVHNQSSLCLVRDPCLPSAYLRALGSILRT